MRRRKHWGWGYEDDAWSPEQLRAAMPGLEEHLRIAGATEIETPVALEDVVLREPHVTAPATLADICFSDMHARASHAWGKSYSDIVRGFRGRFDFPPDIVARPRGERDVEAVLEWAGTANVAVVPYGGGTSVVGGVQCEVPARFDGVLSLDLSAMDRVLQIDEVSQSANIQAGATGPVLERQLKALDLTLRFYPQSFELATLGGWIATRAGGHFATAETHIDDLVESVRAVTPAGAWQSPRVPRSGAGVSPDRMLLGSEGTLGIITEAWVRVRPRPQAHSLAAVRFGAFAEGVAALRAISQSGLRPSNCRLIDAEEARMTGAADGTAALLVLGFEAASEAVLPVGELLDRALALCADEGGEWDDSTVRRPRFAGDKGGGAGGDAVGAWRTAFFRAPYLRDAFVAMGILSETFETAITWERFDALHAAVTAAATEAIGEGGRVTCRISHVYPDGPAPYFTVLAPARRGAELEQWAQIKRAATDALVAAGGTITHHHAVGRDHRPWYDRQRPDPFAAALRAAKGAVDPAGLLNPGVLIDP
ncbi:MAG: alkyldihydroxyacetonephosphate synthase [Solirubrobacteraceae bacterium]|jgi:alkyldihydroxyacetonephosphate synthase|nr:alkyldihydroxyacetonephosphate synthase [Solirubrobacteraceae bacterium]